MVRFDSAYHQESKWHQIILFLLLVVLQKFVDNRFRFEIVSKVVIPFEKSLR